MTDSTGPRRLYRSRRNRMIAGVCGGIAEYFGWDPTVVRVVTVLTILLPGPQFLAYIIAWILVPEEPVATNPAAGAEGWGSP